MDTKTLDMFNMTNDDFVYTLDIIETTGYVISFIATLLSILIYIYARPLHITQRKIRLRIFFFKLTEITIRLTFRKPTEWDIIIKMPYVCEAINLFLEYLITTILCWLNIDGVYLYLFIKNKNVAHFNTYFCYYCVAGWSLPAILIALWRLVIEVFYSHEGFKICQYSNINLAYWLLKGPRLALITVNLLLFCKNFSMLINIDKETKMVVLMKIKRGLKKASPFIIILGFTNILVVFETSISDNHNYAFLAFPVRTLRPYRGFLLSIIYCFVNAEVHSALRRIITDIYQRCSAQGHRRRRRQLHYTEEECIELQNINNNTSNRITENSPGLRSNQCGHREHENNEKFKLGTETDITEL